MSEQRRLDELWWVDTGKPKGSGVLGSYVLALQERAELLCGKEWRLAKAWVKLRLLGLGLPPTSLTAGRLRPVHRVPRLPVYGLVLLAFDAASCLYVVDRWALGRLNPAMAPLWGLLLRCKLTVSVPLG